MTEASRSPAIPAFETIQENLRLQIAPKEYAALGAGVVTQPMSDRVVVAFAIDAPNALSYVRREHLQTWGVSVERLHERCLANLEVASTGVAIDTREGPNGAGAYAVFALDDGYTAARILCPDFGARLRQAMGPRVLAGIPNRDFLVVWTPDYGRRRAFAERISNDFQSRPHPLTDESFVTAAQAFHPITGAEAVAAGMGPSE
jgi:uncharacterized protein YtpQ (UPF0354 family)